VRPVAAGLSAAHAEPAAARPGSTCGGTSTLLAADTSAATSTAQTIARALPVPAAYDWPLKSFDRQHPVRAFLDDPRIGHNGGLAFHFGIDVAAPDGTPVYAVEGGKVFFDSAEAIAVKVGPQHEF